MGFVKADHRSSSAIPSASSDANGPEATTYASLPPVGSYVRARRSTWDAVQANNRLEFPDPRLPTYEGFSEWVEGVLEIRHVHSDLAPIDYDEVNVDGEAVDVTSVELVPR